MGMLQQLYNLQGYKVRFTTQDGEYEGIVKFIFPEIKKVTFSHVFYIPDNEYVGNLNFFVHEFKTLTRVSDIRYAALDCKIQPFKFTSRRNENCVKYLFDDDFESEQNHDVSEQIEFEKEEFILDLPPDFVNKLPQDVVILTSINSDFDLALNHISRQHVIGVSFDGPLISRSGKLTWISICTSYCVFLFDIEALNSDAFDSGLRNVFQAKNIEKVIHDCRQPSDCLIHLYSTELINVFDTQVADFIVNKQLFSEEKLSLKYVSSLDTCLVTRLQVPQEFLYNRRKHLSYPAEVEFFCQRPISHEYQNVLIKNVIYLVLLKEKLLDLMQSPFHKAVEIYLNVLSTASDAELLLEPSVPNKIPPAILMSNIQTVSFKHKQSSTSFPYTVPFKNGEGTTIRKDVNSKNRKTSGTAVNMSECAEKLPQVDVDENPCSTLGSKISALKSGKSSRCKHADLSPKLILLDQSCKKNNSVEETSNEMVDHMQIMYSNMHVDKVFHKLVNDQNSCNAFNINPKSVSNITVVSSRSNLSENMQDFGAISNSDEDKCKDTEVWSNLRAAYDTKCEVKRKNVIFVPAGAF